MLTAEQILNEMSKQRLKPLFTKEYYKASSANKRTLLAALGYFGATVDLSIKNVGINIIKKLNPTKHYKTVNEISLELYGIDINEHLDNIGMFKWTSRTDWQVKAIKSKRIMTAKGRTDMYIKGAGKPRYSPDFYWTVNDFIYGQYFNNPYSLKKAMLNERDAVRLLQLDFPETRIDELEFAIFTGLDIHKQKLAVILRRLDHIVERNLKTTYLDHFRIDYDSNVKHIDALYDLVQANNMVLPSTGKELKAAALRFKNCAANYVEDAVRGKTIIMYNDEHMAQVSPSNLILQQFYGKRNSPPTVEWVNV